MEHVVEVGADADAVARSGARHVAAWARAAVADHGRFTFAVSGGRTPWQMFAHLAAEDVPWGDVVVFQVDERVAPDDDPDRNLAHLRAALGDAPARVVPMPVPAVDDDGAGALDADLDAAAARYAAELPARFDLVHLGLGPDGHTASLVPGDAVLAVSDRLVAATGGEYQGRRRLTLTYPALARADQLLWLVTGADKRDALARLLAGDTSIPAGRVAARTSLVLADADAIVA